MKKEPYYRNPDFEEKTKAELQKAQESLQALLDNWLSLDLGPCENLFQLVMHPADAYKEGVAKTGGLPETFGKYKLKEGVLLDLVDLPIPNELYVKARDCRKISWTAIPKLWNIQDGKIIMDEELALTFIDSKSIYCVNEKQRVFVSHVARYIESSNWLHDKLINLPGLNVMYSLPWSIEARSFPTLCKLSMSPPQMAEILKSLQ